MKFEFFFQKLLGFLPFYVLLFTQTISELRQTSAFHVTFPCILYYHLYSGCRVGVTEWRLRSKKEEHFGASPS